MVDRLTMTVIWHDNSISSKEFLNFNQSHLRALPFNEGVAQSCNIVGTLKLKPYKQNQFNSGVCLSPANFKV